MARDGLTRPMIWISGITLAALCAVVMVAEIVSRAEFAAIPRRDIPSVRADGNLVLSTPSLDFGGAGIARLLGPAQSVQITNDGATPLSIHGVTLGGADALEFTHDGRPTVLHPGESAMVNVWFDPASPGMKTASLDIACGAPLNRVARVELSGAGLVREVASAGGSIQFEIR